MRILFVINDLGLIDPAGIAYLSAIARDLGHERFLCILKRQDITKSIERIKPDMIAYSLNSCEAEEVVKVHKEKVAPTGIFTIMGGPHPTLYPETMYEYGIDAYCIGEGEKAFSDVLKEFQENHFLVRPIPNIQHSFAHSEMGHLYDLENLPLPDRDLVLGYTRLSKYPRKTFLTSRGCPYQCTYCFNPALHKIRAKEGPWVRRFPVDHIIRQIKDVRSKHSLNFVKFDDDNFATRTDAWIEELCYRYSKEIHLPFNCLIRLESAEEPLLRLLKKAGCYSITTSVDSTNRTIREEILKRRGGTNDEIISAMNRVKEHHINLFVNYITAIPTATIEDELATLQMSRAGGVSYANYTALVPFPGTEIWQYCKDHHLCRDEVSMPTSLIKPSQLVGFSKKEFRVQRNVLLLGAYSCVLPKFLLRPLLWLIRLVPSNKIFVLLYSILKSMRISTRVYRTRTNFLQQAAITWRATVNDLRQT